MHAKGAIKKSHNAKQKMKDVSKDLPGRFCLFDSGAKKQFFHLYPKQGQDHNALCSASELKKQNLMKMKLLRC